MENKKMTKREKFELLLTYVQQNEVEFENLSNEETVEFLEHEIEILSKKHSTKSAKATADEEKNAEFREIILEVLSSGEAMTITEIQKSNEELGAITNQKITHLLRKMIDDEVVVRILDKKKACYKMA
jgi:hypothetical protein